ncbi:albusnodin/ikarugamycin family macrolactam cyclase [Streptomyces sp. NPDC048481]|uniref:albusnodin/ikarugamycin family macrolactam cyclase n=1 Tax=Streptomyces sp. NPDC048481 TaxID=3365557 RepID=UPI00371AA251
MFTSDASLPATESREPVPGPRLPRDPAVAGVFPSTGSPLPPPGTAALGAVRVWPAEGPLWSWGPWHPRELRTAACARARLVAVGQCLADAATMRRDLERSAADGHWERLTRWPGAYLLIVMHDQGRLTAYTDPAGQFPLYYAQRGNRTVLSTRATTAALLAGTADTADPTTLAAHIVCPTVPELTEGHTTLAGVRHLGGGQALRIDPSGSLHRGTYACLDSGHGGKGFAETAERLRSALTDSVSLRTTGSTRLTADFSGGLDSTSLAVLAARASHQPLDAFVYHHPEAPAGDLEHALAHAATTPGIRLHVTRGNRTSLPYGAMDAEGPTDQPDPAAVIGARLRLRLDHIADGGRAIHLTGEGGDALLTAPPSWLADLPAADGLRRLVRDGRALARMRKISPAHTVLRALRLARTSKPQAFDNLALQLEQPARHEANWLDAVAWWPPPGPEAAWLTTRMRRRLAELARDCARSAHPDPALATTPASRAVLQEVRNSAAVQRQLVDRARPLGIWPHAPFLDGDVVRACLSLPLVHRTDPFTVKPLLAAALAGLVPGAVLRRRTKGEYSAENYRGARLSAEDIRARLAASPLADLGVIEPSRVIASLDRAVAGLPAPFPALNRLLGEDMWLASRAGGKEPT